MNLDMGFPPQVFLIGAQKAGTTSLAYLLGQHPKICLSDPKETHYFTNNWGKGESWYRQRFNGVEGQLYLDASPSYSAGRSATCPHSVGEPSGQYKETPRRMYRLSPEAKLIYILRNPVDRAYSSYWHSVRAGNEQRSFSEVIREKGFYLRVGLYYEQINRYFEFYDRKAVLILFFEDLRVDVMSVTRECFRFLDIEDNVELQAKGAKNKSFAYGSTGVIVNHFLQPLGGIKKVSKFIRPLVPDSVKNMVIKLLTDSIPPMNLEDRQFLSEYYKEPNRQLELMLGYQIKQWN